MDNLSGFSRAEKDACLSIVDIIMQCTNISRKEGILGLEECLPGFGNDFLTFVMMLVVDGTEPELVKSIGETLINTENHSGSALLERKLILEGVLNIQVGEKPHIIEIKLLSMLGEDYLRKKGHFPGIASYDATDERVSALINKNAMPESAAFDETMLRLENREIQHVLKDISLVDLVVALKGCGGEAAKKIISNLSQRLATMVLDDMDSMGSVRAKDVVEAQNHFTDAIEKLTVLGEIRPRADR